MDNMFKSDSDQQQKQPPQHPRPMAADFDLSLEMCSKFATQLTLRDRAPDLKTQRVEIREEENKSRKNVSPPATSLKSATRPYPKTLGLDPNTLLPPQSPKKDNCPPRKSSDPDENNVDTNVKEKPESGDKQTKKAKRYYLGLKNLGNTCYLNASLQALFLTSSLRSYLTRTTKTATEDTKVVHAVLAPLFARMDRGSSKRNHYLVPEEFVNAFIAKKPQFVRGEQHDAQEFITILVDIIHEEVNKAAKATPAHERLSPTNAEEAWSYHFKYIDKSHLAKIFLSQVESCLECSKCHHRSLSWNCCWQIPLNLVDEADASSQQQQQQQQAPPEITIEDCLKEFTRRENLDDPYCERCKTNGPASKQQTICRASRYLILVLKRFNYTGRKITRNVDVHRRLKIAGEEYQLYACVLHKGNESLGHYMTLYNQHGADVDWLLFDDEEIVETVTLDKVNIYLKELSYICFFKLVKKGGAGRTTTLDQSSVPIATSTAPSPPAAAAAKQPPKLFHDMQGVQELPDIYNDRN